jgi:hypothetical protein
MSEQKRVPVWRRVVAIVMRTAASLIAVVALLMGVGAVRWIATELRTGERSTQPLLGVEFSLGEALAAGTVILLSAVAALWLLAGRIGRQRHSR